MPGQAALNMSTTSPHVYTRLLELPSEGVMPVRGVMSHAFCHSALTASRVMWELRLFHIRSCWKISVPSLLLLWLSLEVSDLFSLKMPTCAIKHLVR